VPKYGLRVRYKLDSTGFKPWRKQEIVFSPDRPDHLRTHPASAQWVPGLSPGVKRPGRGVNNAPSTAEVKERVGLHLPLLILWAFMVGYKEKLTLAFMIANKLQTC
jgi:hypothetical protein